MFRVVLFVCVMMFVSASGMTAQQDIGCRGTNFLLSFLPGFHTASDSLYVIAYSSIATTVTIEGQATDGSSHNRSYKITDPRRALTIGFAARDMELSGFVQDTSRNSVDQSETILRNPGLRIYSSDPVNIVALTTGAGSGDAFAVLPVDMLGKSYVVAAYNSTAIASDSSLTTPDVHLSAPSQFVIVADEDETDVIISLSTKTSHGNSGQQNVRLNRGQSYLVQSAIDTNTADGDLSSTTIVASHPVAVFAGQQSAAIPSGGLKSPGVRRSFIAEQLVPMERWGTTVVAVPFTLSENGLVAGGDFYRVFAAQDGTGVMVDGVQKATLRAGEFYQAAIDKPCVVTASSAINVMQYKSSTQAVGQVTLANATMISMPPVESYNRNHEFVALQYYENGSKVYAYQYMLVVAPLSSIKSVLFDGEPVSPVWSPVGTSGYSYMIRRISDGKHTLSCDEPCSLQLLGTSTDRCYAYTPDAGLPLHAYLEPFVRIPDAEAAIGDTTIIHAFIDSLNFPPPLLRLKPVSFSFDLKFNSTILTPADSSLRGEIHDGYQVIHYHDTMSSVQSMRQLLSLPMVCGLGDAESTTLEIQNMRWFEENGDSVAIVLRQSDGIFRVKNVWHDSLGTRLVNPQVGDLKVDVTPNPMNSRAFINCYSSMVSEDKPVLRLFNTLGVEVRDFSDEMKNFNHHVQIIFDAEGLESGVYYLRFGLADKSAVRLIVIQ